MNRGFSNNGFLDMAPKAHITKVKTGELDYVKIKNFCASKNTTINIIKMQHV